MTSVFYWQNSVSLCPASFCTPRPNLPVILGNSLLPTFAFQSPMKKGTFFFFFIFFLIVNSRRSCRSSQDHSTLVFFSLTGQDLDLDYCDIEWFSFEANRNNFVVFEIKPKYCILDSFVDYEGYSISCPQ